MSQKKAKEAVHLSEMLQQFMRKNQQHNVNLPDYRIWEIWDQAVGTEISKHAKPINFVRGKLIVGTNNSAWTTELQFRSQKIKDRLNTILGKKIVKEIIFRLHFQK